MPAVPECVLCDWVYDPAEKPCFVYRAGGRLPLRWDTEGAYPVREVWLDEALGESVPWVALVSHWADEHPSALTGLIDAWELSQEPVRLGS